jgi:hypothetical protein
MVKPKHSLDLNLKIDRLRINKYHGSCRLALGCLLYLDPALW